MLGYVFPVDKKWLEKEDYKSYKGILRDLSNPFDREFGFTPLILEWELSVPRNFASVECKRYDYDIKLYYNYADLVYPCCSRIQIYDYNCQSLLQSIEHEFRNLFYYSPYDYVSSAGYCSCSPGYEGNPYLNEGCTDINECSYSLCPDGWTCINRPGSFSCENPGNDHRIRDKIIRAAIIIGSVRGSIIVVIILFFAAWKSNKVITEFIKAMRRHMFYKRNGGLLLEQHLSATENGLERTKLFTSLELARATDHYNENRILGRGGQGTVYKGMLTDGRIVAVNKSKRVEDGDLEVFINEVVILSQVNHRNVVKLLGC